MKKTIIILGSALFVTITTLSSCQLSAKKIENAENKVEENKTELAQSVKNLEQAKQDSITEYEIFRKDAEKIIDAQEKSIAEFKVKMANESKEVKAEYEVKLAELEKKNNELKRKLADYKDDGQDNWINFKNEFNHDMNELGKAFNNLIVNNKK
jgi:hypothetical protein